MSSSNCCFLTCIQISQEAGQVVWCSHLFQNFPQFIVIHTVKDFGIVNKAEVKSFSCVQLLVTPWTIAYQAPQSMGFSRQEYWSGVPFPSPGDPPYPGVEPGSPALWADALSSKPPGKPHTMWKSLYKCSPVTSENCLERISKFLMNEWMILGLNKLEECRIDSLL